MSGRWEFKNQHFRRGKPNLLSLIQRRRRNSTHAAHDRPKSSSASPSHSSRDHSTCYSSSFPQPLLGPIEQENEALKKANDDLKLELAEVKRKRDILLGLLSNHVDEEATLPSFRFEVPPSQLGMAHHCHLRSLSIFHHRERRSSFSTFTNNHRRDLNIRRPSRIHSSLSTPPPNMDFPFLSKPHSTLISDLLASLTPHLNLHPSDAAAPLRFQNPSASSLGCLLLQPGSSSSPIDLLLQSWIHSSLPSGAALDITTIAGYLRSTSTSAPHLLLEFIQSDPPKSMVLVADLLPREDLVLHPDYLHLFYESTQLQNLRREVEAIPGARPYVSSSLYVRSALSPTAISVVIENEEVIGEKVADAVREVVGIWLEKCVADEKGEIGEEERELLKRRDAILKKKTIEVDLTANMPRLFGEDVADEVVAAVQKAFGLM